MSTSSFFSGGESPQTNIYEDEAKASADAAAVSAAEAAGSAAQSATSADEAAGQALYADQRANAALASQNAASTSATNAANSASAASTSASNAATSASGSSTSATNAATSASAAAGSATSASTSATNAANSASAAAGSATDAASSTSAASTSATNAASSATSASGSAATATAKASEAATSAANAATSASAAAGSATSASGSATSASGSASSASTSATNAANSATAAANSASAASTSATNAASAQTAAESARDATLAAFDSFDDRYLGPKTSDPTLDNDGNALVAGALYFNSAAGEMRVYTGSVWAAAYVSGSGVLLQANNLSDLASVATARTNLGLATVAATGAYADLSGKPTNVSSFTNDSGYLTSFTEADPTVPSHVKAITATNITNWNAAYGWGNHASAGYLTGSAIGSTVQGYDADLGAIAALSGTTGLLKKTAANTWTLDTSTYLTGITSGQVTTALGYTPYSDAGGTISGNVGIGTSSPGYKLDVVAADTTANLGYALRLRHNTTAGAATLQFTDDPVSTQYAVITSSTSEFTLRSSSTRPLTFWTNGSERMRIDSAGNVGIGTSSPASTLDVGGTIRTGAGGSDPGTGAALYFVGSGAYQTVVAGAAFAVNTGGNNARTERMRIDSSGNVGIGTSSPGAKLDVAGTNGNVQINAAGDQVSYIYNGYNYLTASGAAATLQIQASGASGKLTFATAGSERFRITSTGGITSSDLADAVGYKGIPQNVQSGNYTLALTDQGKHIYSANTGAQTITIPTNASVAFPIGATITIVNMGTTKIVLDATGVSVYANGSTTATAYLIIAPGNSVQFLKTGTNAWNVTFGAMQLAQYSYLVVAGGGGGGAYSYGGGGGGGAGGLLYGTGSAISAGTLTVTIGGGGAANTTGSNTTFGTMTALGGGGVNGPSNGYDGGSGGGGGWVGSGGAALQPSAATPGFGNAGGNGWYDSSYTYLAAGGGGGAGGAGGVGGWSGGGAGGAGRYFDITGASLPYAGGGGGSATSNLPQGAGGVGGGGAGSYGTGTSGSANTGGGGGGGSTPGVGGSGVVIIASSIPAVSTTGSPTVTTVGKNTIYKFTSSGTITW